MLYHKCMGNEAPDQAEEIAGMVDEINTIYKDMTGKDLSSRYEFFSS